MAVEQKALTMMDMMNMPAGVMMAFWTVLGLFLLIFVTMVLVAVYRAAQEAREFYGRANEEHRASQRKRSIRQTHESG